MSHNEHHEQPLEYTPNVVEEKVGGEFNGSKILWPLVILAIVAGLAFLVLKNCGCKTHEVCNTHGTEQAAHGEHAAATAAEPTATAGGDVHLTLDNNIKIDAKKGGIEEQLVEFLKTNYAALPTDSLKKIWFDFDNLNFETGSAKITEASQVQVNNLAAILKNFPTAKLKIGGYTDKVGNEASNVKLSGDRATAVKLALEKLGVGSQVVGAEGYGSQFAKYEATAAEADRVKDRRVAVNVRL